MSVRFSIALMCVFAVGCGIKNAASTEPGDGGGSGSGSGSIGECGQDSDCAPAGTDCCACPSYAIPVSDPAHLACEDVPCEPQSCSTDVRAACHEGACVLTCAVMTCNLTCDNGFALDANGCLTCTCADDHGGAPECAVATDCTRVEADCCGCALGGTDTAVPNADVAAHQQQLDCPMNPQCPGVDTCRADLAPACVDGACALVPPPPVGECGLTGDAPCGTGETCDLNLDADATDHAAGLCGTPP